MNRLAARIKREWPLYVVLVLFLSYSYISQASTRTPCAPYQTAITAAARAVHGPGAPVALSAASLHQESSCNPRAVSRAGAQGLAQFMPGTAGDMGRHHPAECYPVDPFSPLWAIWCRERYMQSLLRQNAAAATDCDQWVFALWGYNGGQGWVNRDRRLAEASGVDSTRYINVASFNAGRSAANFHENRTYSTRIIALQQRYSSWGSGICEAPR